jgi:nucleotide-binding universal stress UspA family protein
MYRRIIVPTDGSDFSLRALRPALAIAERFDARVEIVEVVTHFGDANLATSFLREKLDGTVDQSRVQVSTLVMGDDVAHTIAEHVKGGPDTLVVMSSVGRGRSVGLVGSTAESLLFDLHMPVMVIGPQADPDDVHVSGDIVVPVDGSPISARAIDLAGVWAAKLDLHPWIVTVLDPAAGDMPNDVIASGYVSRLAHHLGERIGREVDFETLRDKHAAEELCRFAAERKAAMIVISTHGRTGLRRVALGSTAMHVVHHAPCPVLLQLPSPPE